MHAVCIDSQEKATRFGGKVAVSDIRAIDELTQDEYTLEGILHLNNIEEDDIPVVIWAPAYYVQKRSDKRLIRLRCGLYTTRNHKTKQLYVAGAIRDEKLYVVVESSPDKVRDISKLSPVRVTNITGAHRVLRKKFFPQS